jgi:hypothetical protein
MARRLLLNQATNIRRVLNSDVALLYIIHLKRYLDLARPLLDGLVILRLMLHPHQALHVSNEHQLELDHFSSMALCDVDFDDETATIMSPLTTMHKPVLALNPAIEITLHKRAVPHAPELQHHTKAHEVGVEVSMVVRLLLNQCLFMIGPTNPVQHKRPDLDLDKPALIYREAR